MDSTRLVRRALSGGPTFWERGGGVIAGGGTCLTQIVSPHKFCQGWHAILFVCFGEGADCLKRKRPNLKTIQLWKITINHTKVCLQSGYILSPKKLSIHKYFMKYFGFGLETVQKMDLCTILVFLKMIK